MFLFMEGFMSKRIHIGNLSFSTTEESLKDAFLKFGDVESVSIIKDKFSGTSKGFGFVEMSSEEKATQAIAKLNGSNLDGRKIRVSEATENKKH